MRRSHRRALIALACLGALALAAVHRGGWGGGERGGESHGRSPVPTAPRASLPASSAHRPGARAGTAPGVVAVLSRPGRAGADVVGFDPAGPRALVVWQRAGDDAPLAVGRVRSEPDGSFAARGLLVPARGGRISVAPAGTDPGWVPGRVPGATAIAAEAAAPGPLQAWRDGPELVVGLPARAGTWLLAGASRRPAAELEIPASPRRGAIWRRELSAIAPGVAIEWIAPAPPAGRRPAWRRLPVAEAARTPEHDPAHEPAEEPS